MKPIILSHFIEHVSYQNLTAVVTGRDILVPGVRAGACLGDLQNVGDMLPLFFGGL